jgi:flagellar biosynthesis chaperone FliJ
LSAQLKQRERLRRLREARERVREAELARAVARVREAELEIARLECVKRLGLEEAHAGLVAGVPAQRLIGESVSVVAERARAQVDSVREELAGREAAARAAFVQAKRSAEQARLLEDASRCAAVYEERRREQTLRDDRFAARAYWTRLSSRLRVVS